MGKLTGYAALATVQPDDVLPIVDVDDTAMALSGTTKKITVATLDSRWLKTDWINAVAQYGADPTGVADSTTAIQNALNAAAARVAGDNPLGGGTVYLPWGLYLISAPLNIPPQTYLTGQGNITLPLAAFDVQYGGARLYASPSWTPSSATGVVQFLSKTPGGWAKNMEQAGLRNIVIDCSGNTSTNLSGILNTGPAYDIHLQDVFINAAGHNGIHATSQSESGIGPLLPYHHYYERVTCYNSVNTGFNVANFTDCTFSQCLAFGSGGTGWVLGGNADCIFTACRSQWSTAIGFTVGATNGHLLFTGCETDNNGQNGWKINSTAGTGGSITLAGCISECDGRASSAPALLITGCATPVTVTGFTQGMDSVSGTGAPVTGLEVINCTAPVQVTGCYFEGSTQGFLNGGGNTGLTMSNVIAGTGTIGSLTYTAYGTSGLYLCPPATYAPGTQTLLTATSGTVTAFSSANMNTGSFTAPQSGSVVVTAAFTGQYTTIANSVAFALLAHGTSTVVGNLIAHSVPVASVRFPETLVFTVTGLTPGTTYNFDLAAAVQSGQTYTIYALGSSSATPTLNGANAGAPVVMTVQAV